MEFLTAIEQLAPVRLLKGSYYVYPLINALHIAAIGALFASVWLMDFRILGVFRTLPEAPFVALMRRVSLAAFALAVLSGLLLFSVRASDYALLPVFIAKMGLLVLAALNLFLFLTLRDRREDLDAGAAERVVAIGSVLLWTGVLLCGRFIGFA